MQKIESERSEVENNGEGTASDHFPQPHVSCSKLEIGTDNLNQSFIPMDKQLCLLSSMFGNQTYKVEHRPLSVKHRSSGTDVLATWEMHAYTSSCKLYRSAEGYHLKHTSLPLCKYQKTLLI